MNIIETLTERNAHFADHEFAPGLAILPQFGTIVLGCVDPRVDPAHILGAALGEVAVIRNIGGRVTPNVVSEIALLGVLTTKLLGTFVAPNLIVLQHNDCGITRLQDPPEMLAGFFQIDAASLVDKHVGDPWAAVETDIAALRASPLPSALRVTGMVYDVETGRIATVADPAPLRVD